MQKNNENEAMVNLHDGKWFLYNPFALEEQIGTVILYDNASGVDIKLMDKRVGDLDLYMHSKTATKRLFKGTIPDFGYLIVTTKLNYSCTCRQRMFCECLVF
jgi:hypothetical protein